PAPPADAACGWPSIAPRRHGAARGRGRVGFPGGRAPRARRRVRGAPHAAAHGHLREVWEEPLA
ncbi:trehalase, partial [Burkholderia pseudomallei]|uniref:trehalase n=1 Tax=Burkholderia pseudomallei TaxID=28450 RepID=UPI000F08C1B1